MLSTEVLISPGYCAMQKQLHAAPRGYGGRGDKWAGIVWQIAMEYRVASILDYGAGQGSLARWLRAQPLGHVRVAEYDPAIPGKDALPEEADLVVVTDVLEHVEPECLDAVLSHLKHLARTCLFVVVSTKDSNKVLADGRNAHVIIQPGPWWKYRLRQAGFTLHPPPTVVRQDPAKEWIAVLTP